MALQFLVLRSGRSRPNLVGRRQQRLHAAGTHTSADQPTQIIRTPGMGSLVVRNCGNQSGQSTLNPKIESEWLDTLSRTSMRVTGTLDGSGEPGSSFANPI